MQRAAQHPVRSWLFTFRGSCVFEDSLLQGTLLSSLQVCGARMPWVVQGRMPARDKGPLLGIPSRTAGGCQHNRSRALPGREGGARADGLLEETLGCHKLC
mmetsp:Transcript_21600/g.59912  ORF Transcript_21600/g.59912 Transcript_21600/m.59912 type:complete len:101 (-) Transcript_21600:1727-2029(-)